MLAKRRKHQQHVVAWFVSFVGADIAFALTVRLLADMRCVILGRHRQGPARRFWLPATRYMCDNRCPTTTFLNRETLMNPGHRRARSARWFDHYYWRASAPGRWPAKEARTRLWTDAMKHQQQQHLHRRGARIDSG